MTEFTLTEEERIKANAVLKYWLNNFLRTDPINLEKAKTAISRIMEVSGAPIPTKFTVCPSPKAAVEHIAVTYTAHRDGGIEVWDPARPPRLP